MSMRDVEVDALTWSLAALMAVVSWSLTMWLGTARGGFFVVLVLVLAAVRCWRAR